MNRSSRHSLQISRRRLLQGAGVVMALPWLESIPVWGAEPLTKAGAPSPAPRRLAVLFMANGINQKYWTASGSGADMQLGEALSPLEPVKTRINFVKGLFNKAATGVGIHPGMTGNLLSGAPLTKGAELHGGVSMDQVLASRIGEQTVQPSMVLGCEQPATGYHETNFSMAYSSHISWQTPTSPVPMEVFPSLAFDSLFDNRGPLRNKSVLDRVRDQAATLRRQVSAADQAKIDEYFTSISEVEKRAENMRAAQGPGRRRRPGRRRARRGDEAPRQRPARGHPRAHAPDVRHPRPGLPDRQDAHRHPAAVPRHLRASSIPSSTPSLRTTWRATRTTMPSCASTSTTSASTPT